MLSLGLQRGVLIRDVLIREVSLLKRWRCPYFRVSFLEGFQYTLITDSVLNREDGINQ